MNAKNTNYDAFISSKSEDYPIAEEVCDFLEANGLRCFLACRELDRIGESQYANAIDNALDRSEHMIVVASSPDHIKSNWVRYEWGTFVNDLFSNYRSGNLVVVLRGGIAMRELPPRLRHQQMFTFENFRDHILGYVGTENRRKRPRKADKKQDGRCKRPTSDGFVRAVVVPVGGMDGNKLWDGTETYLLPRDWDKGDPLNGFPGDTADIPDDWIVEVPGDYDENGMPMMQLDF